MSNDQSLQKQLKDAVARGDTQAIAALMRQGGVTGLLQNLRAAPATAVQQSRQGSTNSAVQLSATARNALQQGNLLEAVKRLREANPGMTLKAAKEQAEAMGAAMPKRHLQPASSSFASTRERTPTVVMGDKPGSLRWLFVLIAFAALLWWWSGT